MSDSIENKSTIKLYGNARFFKMEFPVLASGNLLKIQQGLPLTNLCCLKILAN